MRTKEMPEIVYEIEPVSPVYQAVLVIINALLISLMVMHRINIYVPLDTTPPINVITPQFIRDIGGFPRKVTTGFYIGKFKEFNIISNEFDLSGVVWFIFNPGIVSLKTLEKFEFEGGLITYKSPPNIQLIGEKLFVEYNINLNFKNLLNYSDFPLDDHVLTLKLINRFLSPSEILFESTHREFIVSAKVRNFGWNEVGEQVQTGYTKIQLDPYDNKKTRTYPDVIFSINYARSGLRYITAILVPILFMFYISLFCMSLQWTPNITVSAAAVTAILAYRFVVDRISPEVGYFMLSDYLYFSLLAASFIVFLTIAIDTFAVKISKLFKTILVTILHTGLLVIIAYFIMF